VRRLYKSFGVKGLIYIWNHLLHVWVLCVKLLAISQIIRMLLKGKALSQTLYYICRQQTANETSYSAGDKHMSGDHTLYFVWKRCRFFHPLLLMDDVFHHRHISWNNVFVRTSLRCLLSVSGGWTPNLTWYIIFRFMSVFSKVVVTLSE
jgi:hypothetical protein